jgi:hypothetical protein
VSPAAAAAPSPAAVASASPSPRGLATVPPAAAGTPRGTATADLPARATLAVALATAVVGPVPVGASRVEVLNVADTAYRGGDPKTAADLYDRVLNTPPGSDETPADSSAIDDLARFRGMLAVLATGDENGAHDQLEALQSADPNAPLTRLASQFWDQYGMTGALRAACAQLQPQLGVAEPTFVTLSGVGVTTRVETLCVPPGR